MNHQGSALFDVSRASPAPRRTPADRFAVRFRFYSYYTGPPTRTPQRPFRATGRDRPENPVVHGERIHNTVPRCYLPLLLKYHDVLYTVMLLLPLRRRVTFAVTRPDICFINNIVLSYHVIPQY